MAVLATFALLTACGGDDTQDVGAGGDDTLVGRTFLSRSVALGGDVDVAVPDDAIRIELRDDGELRAYAGCNHLFGELRSTDDGRLVVGPMGGTEMGCPEDLHDRDEWLMSFLGSEPSWDLDGDTLVLRSGGTVVELLDRRVADPDRPLEGTRWVVDTVLEGETASSTPVEAYLRFEDGQVSGFTGCNELSGTYRRGDGTLEIDPLVQTEIACDPEVMRLEEAVTAIGDTTVEYTIEASRLTLVAPGGAGLVLRADD